eukprot:401058-Prorocentrum_minimum.AAC.3
MVDAVKAMADKGIEDEQRGQKAVARTNESADIGEGHNGPPKEEDAEPGMFHEATEQFESEDEAEAVAGEAAAQEINETPDSPLTIANESNRLIEKETEADQQETEYITNPLASNASQPSPPLLANSAPSEEFANMRAPSGVVFFRQLQQFSDEESDNGESSEREKEEEKEEEQGNGETAMAPSLDQACGASSTAASTAVAPSAPLSGLEEGPKRESPGSVCHRSEGTEGDDSPGGSRDGGGATGEGKTSQGDGPSLKIVPPGAGMDARDDVGLEARPETTLGSQQVAERKTSLEATPKATPETSPEPTTEAKPEATPQATPEATPEAAPEATPESSLSATPAATAKTSLDNTPEAKPETNADATPAATAKTSLDNTPEARPETSADAAPEATPETSTDARPEVPPDTRAKATPAATPETSAAATPEAPPGTRSGATPAATPEAPPGTRSGATPVATPEAPPGTRSGATPKPRPPRSRPKPLSIPPPQEDAVTPPQDPSDPQDDRTGDPSDLFDPSRPRTPPPQPASASSALQFPMPPCTPPGSGSGASGSGSGTFASQNSAESKSAQPETNAPPPDQARSSRPPGAGAGTGTPLSADSERRRSVERSRSAELEDPPLGEAAEHMCKDLGQMVAMWAGEPRVRGSMPDMAAAREAYLVSLARRVASLVPPSEQARALVRLGKALGRAGLHAEARDQFAAVVAAAREGGG